MSALWNALLYVLAFIGALVVGAFLHVTVDDWIAERRERRRAERWLSGDDEGRS